MAQPFVRHAAKPRSTRSLNGCSGHQRRRVPGDPRGGGGGGGGARLPPSSDSDRSAASNDCRIRPSVGDGLHRRRDASMTDDRQPIIHGGRSERASVISRATSNVSVLNNNRGDLLTSAAAGVNVVRPATNFISPSPSSAQIHG